MKRWVDRRTSKGVVVLNSCRLLWFNRAVVAVVCISLVIPGSRAFAENLETPSDGAAPLQKKPLIPDVALGDRGTLLGYVVDGKGVRQGSERLVVRRNGEELASVLTDTEGGFLVSGLGGGVLELEVSGRTTASRLVSRDGTSRGQEGDFAGDG